MNSSFPPRRRRPGTTAACFSILALFLALPCLALSCPAQAAPAASTAEKLHPEIVAELDRLLAAPLTEASAQQRQKIWRACAIRHGALEPLIHDLNQRLASKPGRRLELRTVRVTAHYLRQLGDLAEAQRMLSRIQPAEETVADSLAKAEVFDARGRNREAVAAYRRLLQKPGLDVGLKNKILLRTALMADRSSSRGTALARFASEKGRDPALRNQAAVILALTNKQRDAIRLFKPEGKGTARFRQEVRLAEWSIEARDWRRAQDFAWGAVQNARLKRDRRYALAVLVEAYRRGRQLDDLIDRFAATKDLDVQSREVWIDLLRERGKVDEALRLFRESDRESSQGGGAQFTADMRRKLLEICRETGRDKTLEEAFQSLIKTEPRFLEWRKGLATFYLERGRRADALAVFGDYLQVTKDSRYRMAAAATLMTLGLDELSIRFARECMKTGTQSAKESALLFLFELHKDRGQHTEASAVLAELDALAAPTGLVRQELADAYQRLGDLEKAVAVLTGLKNALGEETKSDTRMKLALLLSMVGREEAALAEWKALWVRTNSIPRRRYIEERMMAVASRLGMLASIVVDLEKKLAAGKAGDREAGLLVSVYIKVNDPVSATEIIEEHMRRSGKKPVEVLTEKSRVFQSCHDYYNFELVVHELIKADPEGRPDYLRQLAMSMMERGQRKEAREVLEQMKQDKTDSVSDEFEAGVLALAGMRREALAAYRRGVARHPERIDTYLLLSNIQRQLGRATRSAGMFQHLAATAEKDDLFTIAIDGILNMRTGRGNRSAPNRLVEWARRVVLERLARRPNKLYLYRLVADLSEELNDKTAIRALKAAVPVAGEQRTQLLRELMAMANPNARRGVISLPVRPQARRNRRNRPVNQDLLMFGRRILGQAEVVPPEVYLELGAAFLEAGDVGSAIKTFNQASRLPEFDEMRRKMAQAFEVASFPAQALRVYEQILSVENNDVQLMTKVGELREQTGREKVAFGLYERGLEALLSRCMFVRTGAVQADAPKPDPRLLLRSRNTDEWDRRYQWLLTGLLATMSEEAADGYLKRQAEKIGRELATLQKERRAGRLAADTGYAQHQRLVRRVLVFHRVAGAFGRLEPLDRLDRQLLAAFAHDAAILEKLVRNRVDWGLLASAQKLIDASSRPEAERQRLARLTGSRGAGGGTGPLSVVEAADRILPLILTGDKEAAKKLLSRVSLSTRNPRALDHISLLVGAATFLRDTDRTLTLCRHWINLGAQHNPTRLYTMVLEILQWGHTVLDQARMRSLTEHLIALIVKDPDRYSLLVRQLPQLGETAGADFLTRQQIERLIKIQLAASDRLIYGIESLIMMLPAEDQVPVLRNVWSLVPKTQRAVFLTTLVARLDHDVEPSFAEFITASFKKGLSEADDGRIIMLRGDTLGTGARVNLALRLAMIDAMIAKEGAQPGLTTGRATLLVKLARTDPSLKPKAIAALQEVLESGFLRRPRNNPRAPIRRRSIPNMLRELGAKHADLVLAAFDAATKPSLATTRKRFQLIQQMGRNDLMPQALRAAVAGHPKDVGLRSQLADALFREGSYREALLVREQGLALQPRSSSLRRRLATEWIRVKNPIQALAVLDAGPKRERRRPVRPQPPRQRRPRMTAEERRRARAATRIGGRRRSTAPMQPVKRALDQGDEDTARREFRLAWRTYSPVHADPYGTVIRQLNRSAGQRLWWPDDGGNRGGGRGGQRGGRTNAGRAAGGRGARAPARPRAAGRPRTPAKQGGQQGGRATGRQGGQQGGRATGRQAGRQGGRTGARQGGRQGGRRQAPGEARQSAGTKPPPQGKPDLGGLPEVLRQKPAAKDRAQNRGNAPARPRNQNRSETTAQSVLVQYDWGREQILQMLRTMDPSALGGRLAGDNYAALVAASVQAEGSEKVLARFLERERLGLSGKIDRGMLAALLDSSSTGTPEQLRTCLQNLTGSLNPQDAAQLRRLARLYVRAGDQDKAAILYQWCALVRGTGRGIGVPLGLRGRGRDDLIAEASRVLKGAHRTRAIAGILSLGQPNSRIPNEHQIRRTLETWMDLLGPAEVLKRSRGTLTLAQNLERRPMRTACKLAALIYARGGEADSAASCLKIALCRIEPPPSNRIVAYHESFAVTGYISLDEIAQLFPKGMQGFVNPDAWLETATRSVLTWIEEKRLDPPVTVQLLSALALRLHEQGHADKAKALLPSLRAAAAGLPQQLLWVVDVARLTGSPRLADRIETELLEAGRLNIERVPLLVARVIESEGPEAGLALGEKAAQLTLHKDLLKHMVEAAKAADKSDRAEHWERIRVQAEEAEKKLTGV